MPQIDLSLLPSKLVPLTVLVLYEGGNSVYIEKARIVKGKVQEFVPLRTKELQKLGKSLKDVETTVGGPIPPNLLYFDNRNDNLHLVWVTQPGERHQVFSKETGIKSGKRPVPGLVWKYYKDELSLFAYVDYKAEETLLYKAPFFNTSTSGVCLGTAKQYIAKQKKHTFQDIITVVENAFFNSEFTHISGTPAEGNLSQWYIRNLNSKEPYDNALLIPLRTQIKSLYGRS